MIHINVGTINMNVSIHINREESCISALKEIRAAAARVVSAANDLEKTPWVAASLNAEKCEREVDKQERQTKKCNHRARRLQPPDEKYLVDCINSYNSLPKTEKKSGLEWLYDMVKSEKPDWWAAHDEERAKANVRTRIQWISIDSEWFNNTGVSKKRSKVNETNFKYLKDHPVKYLWRESLSGKYSKISDEDRGKLEIDHTYDRFKDYIEIKYGDYYVKYSMTKQIVTKEI